MVCQVVFTDVLIVGRLDVDRQSFAPIGLHITALVQKACRESSYKIKRITLAIGLILAFTRKKMFNFNKKSELPMKNSKTSSGPY